MEDFRRPELLESLPKPLESPLLLLAVSEEQLSEASSHSCLRPCLGSVPAPPLYSLASWPGSEGTIPLTSCCCSIVKYVSPVGNSIADNLFLVVCHEMSVKFEENFIHTS